MFNKRKVKKRIVIDPHYIGEFEPWLEEMAEKGLVLDHIENSKCYFEKSEKKNREYRVQYQKEELSEEEYQKFYDAGYQFVCSYKDLYIFAVESGGKNYTLYRDSSMETASIKARRNDIAKRMVGWNLALLLDMLLTYYICNEILPYAYLAIIGGGVLIPLGLMLVVCEIIGVTELIHSTKELTRMKQVGDTRYITFGKSRKVLHRFEQGLGIALIVFMLLGKVLPHWGQIMRGEWTESPNPAVFARMEEIQNNPSLSVDYGFPEISIPPLIKNRGAIEQFVWESQSEALNSQSDYIELRFKWMQKRFMKEMLYMKDIADLDFDRRENYETITEDGLDMVYYLPVGEKRFSIVASKGKRILYMRYRGDKSYKEVLTVMKKELLQAEANGK